MFGHRLKLRRSCSLAKHPTNGSSFLLQRLFLVARLGEYISYCLSTLHLRFLFWTSILKPYTRARRMPRLMQGCKGLCNLIAIDKARGSTRLSIATPKYVCSESHFACGLLKLRLDFTLSGLALGLRRGRKRTPWRYHCSLWSTWLL